MTSTNVSPCRGPNGTTGLLDASLETELIERGAAQLLPQASIQNLEILPSKGFAPEYGCSRCAHFITLAIETDSARFSENLVVKTPLANSSFPVTPEMAACEVSLSELHGSSQFFREHYSRTLAVAYSNSGPVTIETYKEGKILFSVINELGEQMHGGRRACAEGNLINIIERVVDTAVEGWRRHAVGVGGLIFDMGINDILINKDSGSVIFIDADGGKRCGGYETLVKELNLLKEAVNFYCAEFASEAFTEKVEGIFSLAKQTALSESRKLLVA